MKGGLHAAACELERIKYEFITQNKEFVSGVTWRLSAGKSGSITAASSQQTQTHLWIHTWPSCRFIMYGIYEYAYMYMCMYH